MVVLPTSGRGDTAVMLVRAITLDLDDTLWPFGPVAARIEAALNAWMDEYAPTASGGFDVERFRTTFEAIRRDRPELTHRIPELRREVLRVTLGLRHDDPGLTDAALAAVDEARQRVELFPESRAALKRLAARVPLLALTNGNADLGRIGVARWFAGSVSAGDVGVGKPEPAIFHAACERLGLPPRDVLHAGDNLELDVHGALSAGMQAAWVHRDATGEAPDEVLRVRDLAALADALEDRLPAPARAAEAGAPRRF